jgi:hypothetical protein
MYPDENKLDVVPQAGLPKWFYGISGRMLPWLAGAAVLLLLVGITWGLAFAPPGLPAGQQPASSISTCRPRCWRSPAT